MLPPQSVSLVKLTVKLESREAQAHYIVEWRGYETEMSTCETDYLEMCNNLFQKSEISYLKNMQLKYMLFL